MFYWKTKNLAENIKKGDVSESDKKNYYLATSILVTIFMYMGIGEGTTDALATLIECIALLIVIVIGVNITFKTNNGNDGVDYIARVTMLSLPILIKIFVIFIVAGIALGIAIGMSMLGSGGEEIYPSQWPSTVLALMAQVAYFWRVNVHLAYINT